MNLVDQDAVRGYVTGAHPEGRQDLRCRRLRDGSFGLRSHVLTLERGVGLDQIIVRASC